MGIWDPGGGVQRTHVGCENPTHFFGCGAVAVAVSRILGVRKCRFREKWTRGRVDRVSLHGSS